MPIFGPYRSPSPQELARRKDLAAMYTAEYMARGKSRPNAEVAAREKLRRKLNL